MPLPVKSRRIGGRRCGQPTGSDARVAPDQPGCHYETLGVPDTASAAEIHTAFKRRALETHPDKGGAVVEFQSVLEAFQILSDAVQRRLYDQQQPLHLGGRKSHASKVACPWRSQKQHMFLPKLARLLRKMSATCRRDTILTRLSNMQRSALEKHMRDEKAGTGKVASSQLCEPERKYGAGIYHSTRTGGYYAKVFVYSLGLQGHIRKELTDVLNDHVCLMKVAEQLRHFWFDLDVAGRMQVDKLQSHLPAGLLASVQVFFYNRHFIGHRHLQLNFKTLAGGLQAWEVMQEARGTTLFAGNGVTDAYSPEAAMKQWQRVKEAYLQFASGRRSSRAQLEEQLSAWEKQQLPTRLKMDCALHRRQKERVVKARLLQNLNSATSDSTLTRCVERLLEHQGRLSCLPNPVRMPQGARKRAHHELCH